MLSNDRVGSFSSSRQILLRQPKSRFAVDVRQAYVPRLPLPAVLLSGEWSAFGYHLLSSGSFGSGHGSKCLRPPGWSQEQVGISHFSSRICPFFGICKEYFLDT
jgi:hypothetical protein